MLLRHDILDGCLLLSFQSGCLLAGLSLDGSVCVALFRLAFKSGLAYNTSLIYRLILGLVRREPLSRVGSLVTGHDNLLTHIWNDVRP